jgi:1,4-dihydroxy-2-naphthoate polyprenyltransferase
MRFPERSWGLGVGNGGLQVGGSVRLMAVDAPSTSSPPPPALPTGLKAWIVGARPRTLPAAIVPVAVGTAVAWAEHRAGESIGPRRVILALVVSLALQIGVNYANDYSDGVRGTDDVRVGPLRLVGSGVKTARAVKIAALGFLLLAAFAGLLLATVTSWWLLLVGVAAIAAAWGYTGGPRPYGYAGLGELFVFVFFGLVAVVGSAYVQFQRITAGAFVAAVPVGLVATALLVTNNLRDIPGDTVAEKRTLAVRLGDHRTRILYMALIAGAFASVIALAFVLRRPGVLIALIAGTNAVPPVRAVLGGASGRALIPVLGGTGKLQLALGVVLTAGLCW